MGKRGEGLVLARQIDLPVRTSPQLHTGQVRHRRRRTLEDVGEVVLEGLFVDARVVDGDTVGKESKVERAARQAAVRAKMGQRSQPVERLDIVERGSWDTTEHCWFNGLGVLGKAPEKCPSYYEHLAVGASSWVWVDMGLQRKRRAAVDQCGVADKTLEFCENVYSLVDGLGGSSDLVVKVDNLLRGWMRPQREASDNPNTVCASTKSLRYVSALLS